MLVERLGARSIYLTPVIYDGQILAAIGLVETDAPRRWTHDEQARLAQIIERHAPLIFNAHLQTSLRLYVEDLLMLLRLAENVVSQADLEQSLSAVIDSWSKITGTDAAAILRWDEETKLLRLAASKNLPTGIFERYTQGVSLASTDPVIKRRLSG